MSPAASASSPEKTMAQSAKCSGLHSCTTIERTAEGIGVDCFQFTAFWYCFPADLGDAPRAWITNQGWFDKRVMNLWPTVPVAPSTPTLIWRPSSMLYLGYFVSKALDGELLPLGLEGRLDDIRDGTTNLQVWRIPFLRIQGDLQNRFNT